MVRIRERWMPSLAASSSTTVFGSGNDACSRDSGHAGLQRFLLPFRLLLFLLDDFFEDFVWPALLRSLLTVRAAISFARFVLRPFFFADSLMCSYCRLRFALFTPRGGISVLRRSWPPA